MRVLLKFFLFTTLIGPCQASDWYTSDLGWHFGSKYKLGLIELKINGQGDIIGKMHFIDTTKTVSIVGTKISDRSISFVFIDKSQLPYDEDRERLNGVWTVKNNNRMIGWRSKDNWSIQRTRDGELSDAAMTFSPWDCGVNYGHVQMKIDPAAARSSIIKAFNRDKYLKVAWSNNEAEIALWDLTRHGQKPVPAYHKQSMIDSVLQLYDIIHDKNTEQIDDTYEIPIEIGSEVPIVRALRKITFVTFADIDEVGCGGSDREYAVVRKTLLFDGSKFRNNEFKSYIESSLERIFSRPINGTKFDSRTSILESGSIRVPPFTMYAKYRAVAASEVTRNYPGEWDMFDITFEPFEPLGTAKSEYGIMLYVENLTSSKRSWGSNSAPGEEQFTTREDRPGRERQVTEMVARHIGRPPLGKGCVSGSAEYAPDRDKHPSDYAKITINGIPTCVVDAE